MIPTAGLTLRETTFAELFTPKLVTAPGQGYLVVNLRSVAAASLTLSMRAAPQGRS